MPSIQPADPAARRRLLQLILVIIAVGVAGHAALDTWLEGLREMDPAEAAPRLAATLLWSVGILSALLVGLAAYLWRQGGQIRAAGRFPLPGQKVVRDTPVVEGAAARHRGLILQGLGGALLVAAVVLWLAVGRLSLVLAAQAEAATEPADPVAASC